MISPHIHRRIRFGGSVKRFHTWPTIGEQSVAAHTWGVMAILFTICSPSPHLLEYATFHDVCEYDTGDVPSTAKWTSPELKKCMDQLEMKICSDLDIPSGFGLSVEEMNHFKFADLAEMLWWSIEQRDLGSLHARVVYDRVADVINGRFFSMDLKPHMKEAKSFFDATNEAWRMNDSGHA